MTISQLFPLAVIPLYSFLNRCRGTQLYGLAHSTVEGRIFSMIGMAILTALAADGLLQTAEIIGWVFASLMLWCTPAWDAYWSAEIGHKDTPPHSRLWGLGMMTLRMTLAAPCFVGLAFIIGHPQRAYYALGVLTLGLPYYITGYVSKNNPIGYAEYAVGAILGALFAAVLDGLPGALFSGILY